MGNDPWEDLINRLNNDPNSVAAGVYIRGDEGEVIHSEASTLLAEVSIEEARETDFLQGRIDAFYGQLYGGLGGPLADLFSMVENPDEDLIRSFQNPIANQIRGGRAVAAGVIAEVGLTLAPLPKINLLGKLASKTFKFFRGTKGSIAGFKSLGAAGKGFSKTLQTGGNTLKKSTLKALDLSKQQGKIAIESLKKDLGLPPNFHNKIMGNGDVVHSQTGQVLGNLFDYLP